MDYLSQQLIQKAIHPVIALLTFAIFSMIGPVYAAAPSHLTDEIQRGALLAKDPSVLAYGKIPPGAGVEAFKRFTYTNRQADEVENLLNVEAGSEFNLSSHEIASFQALAKGLNAKTADPVAKVVTQQYRTILLQRV